MQVEKLQQAAEASAMVAKSGATVGIGVGFHAWITANATFLTGLAAIFSIIAVPIGLGLNFYFKRKALEVEMKYQRDLAEIRHREEKARR